MNIEAERQLFRGTSGGNEVQGILTSRGVPVYAGGTAVGNKAVQLFNAMNGVRGSAFVEPEWIVMHPTDCQELRLLRDTAGQFLGGGPFMGPYGAGSNLQASGQATGAIDSIWNKAVYVTAAMGGAGTALVGSRAAGAGVEPRGAECGGHELARVLFHIEPDGDQGRTQAWADALSPGRHVRGAARLRLDNSDSLNRRATRAAGRRLSP